MRTLVNLCLAGAVALTLASCACPRCGGLGTEVAMTSGRHTYTNKYYKKGQTISCLKCNGTGQYGNNPSAGVFNSQKMLDASIKTEKGQKGADIYVTEVYETNTYVAPSPAVIVY